MLVEVVVGGYVEIDVGVDYFYLQCYFVMGMFGGDVQGDVVFGGEFDCVVDQVVQCLGQFVGIVFEGIWQVVVQLQGEVQVFFFGVWCVLCVQVVEQVVQVEWFVVWVEFVGLQFDEGEDVVDYLYYVLC